ncbi:hypothetical protein OJF2_35770 [Aquisphaera giovannonii]|uniref:Uncharacterized protein n=1 Tax=Aquisphaera giovannonii TaxID=406548 RepID=A0A5B9W368_9BACT|nr:hypothetical protein [Aquisphaera giovannonii]QEH35032.1 hypothetical protein OJF2_35770 [Aquisphaera giovannonii]
MTRLENYVQQYGPVVGPKLFRTLQSKAAYAGVSARLRRKINAVQGNPPAPPKPEPSYPLFEATPPEPTESVA